jgi:hypothetical protein
VTDHTPTPHVCDDACGIYYEPGCPCWAGYLPSPADLRRLERRREVAALAEDLRPAIIRIVREVAVAEVPALVTALLDTRQRRAVG